MQNMTMQWRCCRSDRQSAPVPNLPRHLATPSLMQRAGDPTFYDEPELGRTTPSAKCLTSQFTEAGIAAAPMSWRKATNA